MKLIVSRDRTVVVGNGENRGPGEEVELFGEEAERFIRIGAVHKPGDSPVPGMGNGPATSLDHTVGLQSRPRG